MWKKLQEPQDSDRSLLLPIVAAASEAMQSKLQSYMKDHLSGGQYYDPEPSVCSILKKLQPHNDRTESLELMTG